MDAPYQNPKTGTKIKVNQMNKTNALTNGLSLNPRMSSSPTVIKLVYAFICSSSKHGPTRTLCILNPNTLYTEYIVEYEYIAHIIILYYRN